MCPEPSIHVCGSLPLTDTHRSAQAPFRLEEPPLAINRITHQVSCHGEGLPMLRLLLPRAFLHSFLEMYYFQRRTRLFGLCEGSFISFCRSSMCYTGLSLTWQLSPACSHSLKVIWDMSWTYMRSQWTWFLTCDLISSSRNPNEYLYQIRRIPVSVPKISCSQKWGRQTDNL